MNINSVSLGLGTPKIPYSSNLWVWQVSSELSTCTLAFPVVWQQGAEVCVIPPFCDSAGQHTTLHWKPHFSTVQLQQSHWFLQWRSPRWGTVIARLWSFEMSSRGFRTLALSSTAWLWKWRLCSTLQMCRDYVSNLQQCWETGFEIIKWMNLLQQSESNPCHDQSSDLGSLAGWNTAKQFWAVVVTNCLWDFSE